MAAVPAEGSVPADSATEEVAPPVGTSGLVLGVVSGTVASGPAPGVDSATPDRTVTVAADDPLVPVVTAATRVATATEAAATEGAAVAAAADGSVHGPQLALVVDTKKQKYVY